MRISLLINKIAFVLIAFFILSYILTFILPIETTETGREQFLVIRFYGLPISILFSIAGSFSFDEKVSHIIFQVVSRIGIAFTVWIISMMIAFSSICSYTTTSVLFINKNNDNKKIVIRNFGCGATDSGAPTIQTFTETEFLPGYFWYSEIDTTQIQLNEWIRK